jgi:hypothetical protein
MVTEAQREQAQRRATLDNDRKVREQGGTFLSHTHSDLGGRYSAVGAQTIVGQTPNPYPAASSSWQIQLPDEPPLGLDNPELEPSFLATSPAQATGEPSDAPSDPLVSERVGSPLSLSDDPTTEGLAPPSASPRAQPGGVGSSPAFRRRV